MATIVMAMMPSSTVLGDRQYPSNNIIIVLAIQENGKYCSETFQKLRKTATFREVLDELVDPNQEADHIICTITSRRPNAGPGVQVDVIDMDMFSLEESITASADRVMYQIITKCKAEKPVNSASRPSYN